MLYFMNHIRYMPELMIDRLKPIPLFFWRTHAGRDVVRDWLREMPSEDRVVIGTDLRTL